MAEVFIVSDNIFSPIGRSAAENFDQVKKDISGIRLHEDKGLSEFPFYASVFESSHHLPVDSIYYTRFEHLLLVSIVYALKEIQIDFRSPKTVLIVSSTKGNINLLESGKFDPVLKKRIALHTSAKKVATDLGFVNPPVVISNACISGLLGILIGKRLIESGQYENAVIVGADLISKFILSGFQSFQAISPEPCKPFDADRKGITLGEGAATVILSSNKQLSTGIRVMGGSISNDANHISAPSRTGAELAHIITTALRESGLSPADIGMVSAHGTATLYNDEMEAKALALAGFDQVPVNSLKGYFGHTLGAAGLIESIISIRAMAENIILPTKGFETLGVDTPLQISNKIVRANITSCLKTASGFGGCNAAVIFSKHN